MPTRLVVPTIVTLLGAAVAVLVWPRSQLPLLAAVLAGIAATIAGLAWLRGRAGATLEHRDMTRLRESEAALRASESRMATLLEEAPAMIAVVRGPDHVFELANAGYRRLVGGRDVVGKPVAVAVPELKGQGVIEMLDNVLATREPFVGTEVPVSYRRQLHGGTDEDARGELEEHFINFVYQPIIDDDGRAIGVFAHGVDVTTQVRARGEVNAARETAEAANNAKSQFLAVMSHELRTPLNAVLGYTELMELGIAGPVTTDQLEYHARVRGSSQHLLSLINELLDLSKIESGQMDVTPVRVSLGRTVRSALELIALQAEAREVAVTVSHSPAAEIPALGDEARIRQVLVNLLSNAVKFTEPGGNVTIDAGESEMAPIVSATSSTLRRPGSGRAPSSWSYVRVTDTGSGIPEEMHDTIFQPFVQLGDGRDSIYRRRQGGTGLGLTISRRLARLMGGDVVVESVVGRGSTFTLWLPGPAAVADRDVSDTRAIRAELGRVLGESVNVIVSALARRVREDPEIPIAGLMSQTELEDHMASYLADFAQQLVILDDEGSTERVALMRDGVEIRHLVVERHGAQRARFGWTEPALTREMDLLQGETEAAARRGLRHLAPSEIEDATGLVRAFLREARSTTIAAYRRSIESEAGGPNALRLDGAARAP